MYRITIACALALASAPQLAKAQGARFVPPPNAVVTDWQIAQWVADLRDDGVRWSAYDACEALSDRREQARPHLLAALDASDVQQRVLAFALLSRDADAPATHGMVRVAIESLRHDSFDGHIRDEPGQPGDRVGCANANDAVAWLVTNVSAAHRALIDALYSDDEQQRFCAAYCLAINGRTEASDKCAAILIPHLRDNDIAEDAVMACSALYRLGPIILPALHTARPNADEQQAQLIDLLILDILNPPRARVDFEQRTKMHDVSVLVHDPAVEIRTRRIMFPDANR